MLETYQENIMYYNAPLRFNDAGDMRSANTCVALMKLYN